jgi:hypothetical protein
MTLSHLPAGAMGSAGITGRRGVAGTVLVHKVSGAAAAAGLALAAVKDEAEKCANAMGTLGETTVGLRCYYCIHLVRGTRSLAVKCANAVGTLGETLRMEPGWVGLCRLSTYLAQ